MEQSTFFREATLAICGHLDIETSLFATFQILQQWMPLDRIYTQLYEPETNCMRIIAKASTSGGESQDILLPLPKEAKSQTESAKAATADNREYFLMVEDEPDPVSRFLLEKLNLPLSSSVLGLPLIIEEEPFGAFILTAEGTGRYTGEHGKLLT
jgi:GAF domain-containing protein